MGMFDRVGGYAKRRANSSSVGMGWDAIQKGQEGLTMENLRPRPKSLKSLWVGPPTEADGKGLYVQRVLPMFASQEDADVFASQSRIVGMLVLAVAFALGVAAFFYATVIFKICGLLGFFILAAIGANYIHRAEQIKERRVFGMRDLLF